MAAISYATQEINAKIVYYGPGLSGKTTNLRIIYEQVPSNLRSNMISLSTEGERTLFFDFLPLDLGKIKGFKIKLHLYTVPGQVYYNATRRLVLRGVDGVVFVADSAPDKMEENIASLQNLYENFTEYRYKIEDIPTVLQYYSITNETCKTQFPLKRCIIILTSVTCHGMKLPQTRE